MPKGRMLLKREDEEDKSIAKPADSDPVDFDEQQYGSDTGDKQRSSDDEESASAEAAAAPMMPKRKRGRPKKIAVSAPAAAESYDEVSDELEAGDDPTMYGGEYENLGAKGEDSHSSDSSANRDASELVNEDEKNQWPKPAGAAAVETRVQRKRGRPRKSDQQPPSGAAAEQQSIHRDGSSARKRGRPKKYPFEESAGSTSGGSLTQSRKRGRPRSSMVRPSATVRVADQADHGDNTEGVYRIMLDISRKVFHEKSVQHVTIRPVNMGEGTALPQGSKVIHLMITDP